MSARSAPLRPLLAAIALAAVVSAAPAAADDIPSPTVAFSGVMEIRYPPAKPLIIRIHYTKRKVRRDLQAYGARFVAIVDHDRDRTFMLFPELKKYAERPLDTDRYDMFKQLAKGATIERLGPESVAGRGAVKYRIDGRSARGRRFLGHLWLTPENIMLRMEAVTEVDGKVRNLRIEMRDLRIGRVDPAVFEIPKDYEKVERK